jgi:hypothetical protein
MSVVAPALVALALLAAGRQGPPPPEAVRVMVVSLLATDRNREVEPRLEEIAEQIRKKDPTLTGFRVERVTSREVRVGRLEKIKVADDVVVEVTVTEKDPKTGRVSVTLKPPAGGAIDYTCCCGKFFPVCTRYQTPDKDRLIVAVMVRPCPPK